MVYLFLGQDSPAKDAQLKKLRQQFLRPESEQFNLDILYGRGLALPSLKEKLFSLPVNSSHRIVVLKEIEGLKEDIREFIAGYCLKPFKQIILVLDAGAEGKKDNFLGRIKRAAKVMQFKSVARPDAFTLGRSLAMNKPAYSLQILHQLLREGARPEQIIGGLRYAWERDFGPALKMRQRLKRLVECDREIKTGRLKPLFALEKLVISLCGLT